MLKCTRGLLMIDRHWDSSDQVAATLSHWSPKYKVTINVITDK